MKDKNTLLEHLIKFSDEKRPAIYCTDLTEATAFFQTGNDLDSALLFNDLRGLCIEIVYTDMIYDTVPVMDYETYKNLHVDIKFMMNLFIENMTDKTIWSFLLCNEAWILTDTKTEHTEYFKDNGSYQIEIHDYDKFVMRFEAEQKKEELEKELPTNNKIEKRLKI